MKKSNLEIKDLISLSEASRISGLSAGHINYLVRNKKLWGVKLGRNWFTTKVTLDNYVNSIRRPGPK